MIVFSQFDEVGRGLSGSNPPLLLRSFPPFDMEGFGGAMLAGVKE